MKRRFFLFGMAAVAATSSGAQSADVWSAAQTQAALEAGQVVLVDIRSREEWAETGVAQGALPVSLHDDGFGERLFQVRQLAGNRPVALICATGGRTAYVMQALRQGGYSGFVDVSEGMMGSALGRGWIAAGLPVVSAQDALSELPDTLR
jgi:rhodanese-related sulfurtransferase